MADVVGPTKSLPGSRHKTPPQQLCDNHPKVPAVCRVQGETDSMGAEMLDYCRECMERYYPTNEPQTSSGICDWCKSVSDELIKHRHIENPTGPVYDVCPECRADEASEVIEEIEPGEAAVLDPFDGDDEVILPDLDYSDDDDSNDDPRRRD